MSADHAPRLGLDAVSKKHGMTLGELANFVSQAYSAGASDDTPLRVVIGMRQQLQSVETRPDKSRPGQEPIR